MRRSVGRMDPELQATVDHVAIGRLQAAYADAVTRRDWLAVQALFLPAMRHRIVLGPTAEIDGRGPDDVLTAILNRQDAPR